MAEEDKEKAEKLAAAKKRFEQLKKEQAKKGKKGGAKKKKDDAGASTDDKAPDAAGDAAQAEETTEAAAAEGDTPSDAVEKEDEADDDATQQPDTAAGKPSLSLQSKQRSESFRSGTAPLSPQNEVTDLYRKQSQQITDLTAENETLKKQQEEGAARLAKTEEELEGLREQVAEAAELKSSAKDAGSLRSENEGLKRQLTQAQKEVKDGASKRRASGPGTEIKDELASKTSTIESLELDISNLRNQLTTLQSTITERESGIKDAEERAQTAETEKDTARQELDQLKVSMTFPSDETKAAGEDPEALTKRISLLESDLRSANASLDAAGQRAKSLEQKLETLTKMHKDATSTSQIKDKELIDLRNELRKRDKPSHVNDASDFDLNEEETETGALQARIRELEAENFDLKRGVWREQRASLQPGMDDEGTAAYEDVDLNGPYGAGAGRGRGFLPRQGSTFQDVLNSGISAFTGRTRDSRGSQGAHERRPIHERKQSLGLLSEDGDFDADAWQQAQEEEAKRRVERVKEVKRGLEQWRGWRVDLVDLRKSAGSGFSNGMAGPVFDV